MRAVVFYATRVGHTRRIAEHIAGGLRTYHVAVDLYNVNALLQRRYSPLILNEPRGKPQPC